MALINVALGKAAAQSSLSIYSDADESGNAVSGVMPERFAFHTAEQIDPWWYVDLGSIVPIHSIVVHNRRDGLRERAARCEVAVSSDLVSWMTIHAGLAFFGSGASQDPLTCVVGSLTSARYVKISIAGLAILHLSQVEVLVDPRHHLCQIVRQRYNLANLHLLDDYRPKTSFGVSYAVLGGDDVLQGRPIRSIKLVRMGRLGNQIRQMTNAIAFAKRNEISAVEIVNHGLVDLRGPLVVDGVRLLPEGHGAPPPCLVGDFFYDFFDLQPALKDFDGLERYRCVARLKAAGLFPDLTAVTDEKKPAELTVHIRAGDLFDRPDPNPGYVQPPLAFYTKVARKLLAEGKIERLRIVYEDFGNPCVAALKDFAERQGLEVRMTSGSLQEDLAALIDAERVMFGVGTFGSAVCLLSQRIEELYFFETIHDAGFATTPSVVRAIAVSDRNSTYIQTGAWHNTKAQRDFMLSFGEDELELRPV